MDWLDRRELRVGLLTRGPRPSSVSPSLDSSQVTQSLAGGGFLRSQKLRLQELQHKRQQLESQRKDKEQYLQYLKRTVALQTRQNTPTVSAKPPAPKIPRARPVQPLGSTWDFIVERERELEKALKGDDQNRYARN